MHDLGSFAQSYPRPDFRHYAPERVYEIGEMWALAKGAGTRAQRGAVLLLGLLQAQAVVGYAIVKPWDLTVFYRELVPTGKPMEWPYARTLDGGKIFCRAMVSEGDHLQRWVEKMWETGFETRDGHRLVRFPSYIGESADRAQKIATVNQLAQDQSSGVSLELPKEGASGVFRSPLVGAEPAIPVSPDSPEEAVADGIRHPQRS